MKILRTVTDKDFGLEIQASEIIYEERLSVRAVIFNKEGQIAVLHSRGRNYHALPGGGVNDKEEIIDALKREVLEEVGCKIKNIKELGIVEEYRNKISRHQLNHYYMADLDGEMGTPQFEEDELEDNFETLFLDLDTATQIIKNELNDGVDYNRNFGITRHTTALEEVKKILVNSLTETRLIG